MWCSPTAGVPLLHPDPKLHEPWGPGPVSVGRTGAGLESPGAMSSRCHRRALTRAYDRMSFPGSTCRSAAV